MVGESLKFLGYNTLEY